MFASASVGLAAEEFLECLGVALEMDTGALGVGDGGGFEERVKDAGGCMGG